MSTSTFILIFLSLLCQLGCVDAPVVSPFTGDFYFPLRVLVDLLIVFTGFGVCTASFIAIVSSVVAIPALCKLSLY
jgi:hypothetical protein